MAPHIDAVGIVADDIPRSLAFYRHLGIDVADPDDGQAHVEATLANGLRFLWDTPATIRSFHPDWAPPTGGARVVPAVRVDSPAEVDALYATLLGAGGTSAVAPFDAPWQMRYATVRDPDGNAVDLFAPLA
jgi:catechol 2,3-dioxygenase-like lactoylglutathione lyase family enzyme